MKTIFHLTALMLITSAVCLGKNTTPEPLEYVTLRGESLPLYAPPKVVDPVHMSKPEFPRDEKGNRVSGAAVVEVLVDLKGQVIEIEAVESKPLAAHGAAAVASIKKWRFPKLQKDGAPTKYLVRVPFVFRLDDGA
jgi:TonB family protein